MKPDGTDQVNLTNHPDIDCISNSPWSPDGSRIVFFTTRDSDWEIYTMNADGSGLANLTNDEGRDQHPSWRPAVPPTAVKVDSWGSVKTIVGEQFR